MIPAVNLRLLFMEGIAWSVALAGAAVNQAFFIAVLAGLVGLLACDAFLYPRKGGPIDQGVATMAALTLCCRN